MTNKEIMAILKKNGVSEAEIKKVTEKFDAEKITEIVESSSTPKEAFKNLHSFYQEIETQKLQDQMDFVQGQIEAATNGHNNCKTIELTENELSMVSGGGLGSWFKNNWKKILIGIGVAVAFSADTPLTASKVLESIFSD